LSHDTRAARKTFTGTPASGRDGTSLVLEANPCDTAGRLIRQTNALGGVTTWTYGTTAEGGRQVTVTDPYDGTRIESYYRDGSLKSISGTAAFPESFKYGAELGQTWTRSIKGDFNSSEWVETWHDMLGRTVRTRYSGGAEASQFYDSGGRLIRSVDPDGVQTLYTYDPEGSLALTVVDMDRDGEVDGRVRIGSAGRSAMCILPTGGSGNGLCCGRPTIRTKVCWYRSSGSAWLTTVRRRT